LKRAKASGEIDITAANSSSFDRKNCITSDASTPASAATRLIVVAAKPSVANRARAASRMACRVVLVPGRRPRRATAAGLFTVTPRTYRFRQ
jgi:hypothetical protein